MKIGKPVIESEIPHRGMYGQIWEAAQSLTEGKALPVEFPSSQEARAFQAGSNNATRRRGLRISLRGTTVYVSRNGRD